MLKVANHVTLTLCICKNFKWAKFCKICGSSNETNWIWRSLF